MCVLKLLQTIQQDPDIVWSGLPNPKTLKALYCDLMAKILQESRYEKELSTHKVATTSEKRLACIQH